MNHFLFFVFGILPFSIFAQFTNAEVYNYQPGDVIERGEFIGYPTIVIDTVLSRYDSPTNDSIVYHIHQTVFQPWSPMHPGFEYELIDTLIITELDSLASHFQDFSCLSPSLTNGIDTTCNRTYSRLLSMGSNQCFEAPSWSSVLYEGLGGPYFSIFYPSDNQFNEWQLMYYNTLNNGECGTFFASTLGASENQLSDVQVSPNPVINALQLSGLEMNTTFEILDLQLRTVFHGIYTDETEMVSTEDWSTGVYFIKTSSGAMIRFQKI